MSLVALRRWFERPAGGSWGDDAGAGEHDALCIRGTDLVFDQLEVDAESAPLRSFTTEDVRRRSLRAGDIVIEKSGGGSTQPVGRVGLFRGSAPAIPTNFAARLRPLSHVDPRFACYQLASLYSAGRTMAAVRQTTGIQNLDLEELLVNPAWLPPLADQRAIADYLDAETVRIDALIAKKQQLVHLLEERRSAFISAAVTTGLESSPMRETGDDLIPAVPVGWRLMRMRHLVERIVDTPHKTAPVVEAEEYLVVRTANVKNGRLVYTGARYTDVESWRQWNRNGAPRVGDVLFTREAPAGEACVVPPDQPLCLGQRMVLLQVDRRRTTGEWLVHSIYAGPAQRFIEVYSNSTTVAHLNMSDIPDIPVAVPPLDEQSRLLSAIQHVDESVYRSKETLMDQLDLLAERRQALITAAVTGEFVVPGAA